MPIQSVDQLETLMRERFENREGKQVNTFWLELCPDEKPSLSVHVAGEWAYAYFFKDDQSAEFHSVGNLDAFRAVDSVSFCGIGSLNDGDCIEVPGYAVIPVQTAVTAAREFFLTGVLPKSLAWSEL